MILLERNQWHARVYRWAVWQLTYFRGKVTPGSATERTNVCRFIRTLLVKLPLLIACHGAVLALAIWTLVMEPIHILGFNRFAYTLGAIDGMVVAAYLGIIGLAWGAKFIIPMLQIAYTNHLAKQLAKPPTGPSIFALIGRWLKDRHENICSSITIQ